MTIPLTDLLKKNTPFKWTSVEDDAFNTIKKEYDYDNLLRHYDHSLLVTIETDTSGFAHGAVLTQNHNGKHYPVTFYSRKLNDAERNYPIHDKELLTVVDALIHF
jgi:hypothetical protein